MPRGIPKKTRAASPGAVKKLDIDFRNFSPEEFRNFMKNAEHQFADTYKDKRAQVKEQVAELVTKAGFSMNELFGRRPYKRREASDSVIVNPSNKEQTWSGRGRKPRWLKEAEAHGKRPAAQKLAA